LERAEVLLLFAGETLEDLAAARVGRQPRGARVELEPAPLGGDRDAQRIAGEHPLGRLAVDRRGLGAGPALVAGTVDLQDRLLRPERGGGGDLLDQPPDIGTGELGRTMALVADEMKMPRRAVGRLEPRPPLSEIDLARDAGGHHPLQRAVDGGAADAGILAAD